MNILITGINGFVGSNLENRWKNIHNIYGIDINTENKANRFSWDQLDEIPDCDIIIHLAGIAQDKKNAEEEIYFRINTELTKKIFDFFSSSKCKTFIFFSSAKAIADVSEDLPLTEDIDPKPVGPYGSSKLLAEKYILENSPKTNDKRTFILRPVMIYGKGNNGNLKLLFNFSKLGIPWPLGRLNGSRSFCYIENLMYIIDELINDTNIKSDVFNVSDDSPLTTNELITIMNQVLGKKSRILHLPKTLFTSVASVGSFLKLPLNKESIQRFSSNFIIDNSKIKRTLGIKKLPYSSEEGLRETLKTLKND